MAAHDPRVDHDPLVLRVARPFCHRLPPSLSWAEFLQEGELALCVARSNFDREAGAGFDAYAYRCVYNHLRGIVKGAYIDKQSDRIDGDPIDRQELGREDAEALADLIWDEVDQLDPFDREVIIRRFGLDGYGEESTLSTSRSMGCGRRRVSGSVRRSLETMRSRLVGDVARWISDGRDDA